MPTRFDQEIAERALGQYPLSVATSLAIESVNGIHPDIPVSKAPILDYNELWVNLRTLFRNFMGALDKETAIKITPPAIAEALSTEMEILESIIRDANSKVKVVFYFSNYANLDRKYPHALLRMDNTPKQKDYTNTLNLTMELMLKDHRDGIKGFDLKVKPDSYQPSALMLTHYAYDLLAYPEFKKLALVESHTGKIKERAQWYTKYYNGDSLSMMPFREDLLQIFGDQIMFRPLDKRLRDDLVELATKYHWTAVTTRDKIRYGIEQLKNPYFKKILLEILV
jgi:hypothetical protein